MRWYTVTKLGEHTGLTPEGYLVAEGVPVARCGAQIYHHSELPLEPNGDGLVHVHRDPTEVFKPDSINSFLGKPIVNDHPVEEVGPRNWNNLAIGFMINPRRGKGADDDVLLADLMFTTPVGIQLVQQGKRAVSVGYDAHYEQIAPGMGRQKNIVCNHLALVDVARCGARCTIMDSGVALYNTECPTCDAEAFVESEHPRDPVGKFTSGAASGASGKSHTFSKGVSEGHVLKGEKLESWTNEPKTNLGWESLASDDKYDKPFDEPALPTPKPGKSQGAGVIIREPDGRVWITHPTNQFGGYKATFPKGTIEPGMSARATALKEAYEETGLRVRLTGHAGDVERDTSTARYYHAERLTGSPDDAGWETEAMTLAHPDDLKGFLNKAHDQKMVDDFIAKAEQAKASAESTPTASAPASGEKLDMSKMHKIGKQLGSNPGGQYQHENGQKYYVKQSKSNDHARNELLAARLYEAAGAPVLPAQEVQMPDGSMGTATPWQDVKLIDANDPAHRAEAQKHFATHAWLSNWDAAGTGWDNQGVVNGKMTTLDPGGALLYRAQGTPKGDKFGDKVGEWDTLRDPNNTYAHKIFGEMKPEHLRASALNVAGVPDTRIRELVDQHGPGIATERKVLADRLIARKRDVVKRALSGGTKDAAFDDWYADIDYDWHEALAA